MMRFRLSLPVEYYGCFMYADDIILLAYTVCAMRCMLKICDQQAIDNVKFNN